VKRHDSDDSTYHAQIQATGIRGTSCESGGRGSGNVHISVLERRLRHGSIRASGGTMNWTTSFFWKINREDEQRSQLL
jgi:hypothetical protein